MVLNKSSLLAHDIRQGILAAWKQYLMALVLFLLLCLELFMTWCYWRESHPAAPVLTAGDLWFHLFQGMKMFDPADTNFRVNISWLMVNLYLAYVVSAYPFRDMKGFGQQVLLRWRNRRTWWLGKCLWSTGGVIVYYGTAAVAVVLFTLCTGGSWNLLPQPEVISTLTDGAASSAMTLPQMAVYGLLNPLLVSMGLSLLQLLVSLLLRPLAGLIVTASLLVISIFSSSPFLPGCYLMLMRTPPQIPDGVGTSGAVLFGLLTLAVTVLVGCAAFARYDIVEKAS